MNKNTTDIDKLWDVIKNLEVAMLTTEDTDGVLRSRPMATQQVGFDGYLWFFTQASAHKVDDVQHHRQVNVSYVDSDKNRYISNSGKAQVVRDSEKARQLWKPYLRAWFPNGVDDVEVALLKVEVHQAEYWDSPSSKMVQLLTFLKSVTTGESPKTPRPGKITIAR